jgi:hypothetical protein
MGLVRELFDELISLPKQADHEILGENIIATKWRIPYAILNLLFQIIDCVIIPYFTMLAFTGHIQNGILSWGILIFGFPASVFSLLQALYYFLIPTEKYVNPLAGRLLGETALGAFLASVLRIRIKSFIK